MSPATRQLLQKNKYAEALPEIDQRLRTDSLNTDLLGLRAECHLALMSDGHATIALADLNKALRLRPGTWLYLFERSYAYFLLRRYQESVGDLDAALKQTPAAPALLYQRGYSQLSANHLPEALTDFAQASSLDPNEQEYALMVAIGQMLNGRYPEAQKTCSSVLNKHKGYGLAYANRALVRQHLNDLPGARQDADEALRIAPTDSTSRLISAFIYEQTGESAKAKQLYDAIQAQYRDKTTLYSERGDLYLQVGNLAAAEADWKEGARLGNLVAASRLAAGFKPQP